MHRIVLLTLFFIFLLAHCVSAANKAVVIPLKKNLNMKNEITVAPLGGDFTDPAAALQGISGASASNPYVVVIGPGVYNLSRTLVMKPYVSVTGSGEQATKLTGSISTGSDDATSAIVAMASNSSLTGLSVENRGGNAYSIGIYTSGSKLEIQGVTVTASGGTTSIGVHNYFSTAVLKDVAAAASGGTINYGIFNFCSTMIMANVNSRSTGGAESFAVYNESSSPTMTYVTATASGGSDNRGIANNFSFPTMLNVTASASGGRSYGMRSDNSLVKVRVSTLSGGNYGVYSEGGALSLLSQSTVIGGSGIDTGTNVCTFVDNGSGGVLSTLCF